MRGWRKLRGLLLAVCLLAALCVSAAAAETKIIQSGNYELLLTMNENGTWTVQDNAETKTDRGDLVIPSEVDGIAVTEIADRGFYQDQSTGTLTLPENLERIGSSAFAYSAFTGEVCLPESLTEIGAYAFEKSPGFTGHLLIPGGVKVLEYSTFSGTSFTGLTLSEGLETIKGYAFYKLTTLTGDLVIPDTVTVIGSNAFVGCSGFDGTLTIGRGVKTIESEAFARVGFTGLVFRTGDADIGSDAFSYCKKLRGDLTIPEGSGTIRRSAFFESYGTEPGTLTVGARYVERMAFRDTTFAAVCVGKGVEIIEDYGFADINAVTDVRIESQSLTEIGKYAFRDAKSGGDLILPDTLTTIGDYVFAGVFTDTTRPGKLVLSESLTNIGTEAFRGCKAFNGDLCLPDSLTEIGSHLFAGCSGFDGILKLPANLTVIGEYAFSNCTGLTGDLYIPDSVISIGEHAFGNCCSFSGTLRLPEGLTDIQAGAFENCSGLSGKLELPDGMTVINGVVFSGCTGFSALELPQQLTIIGARAFDGCSGLTGELKIPSGVTEIGQYAFNKCSGLTTLTLPRNLTKLDKGVFNDCSGLSGELQLPGALTEIGISAFYNCSGFSSSLVLPEGLVTIGNYAFAECTGFTGDLIIADSVERVGYNAFENCTGFDGTLVLSKSMTTIESNTFSGMTNLSGEIYFPDGLTAIGERAFYNCYNMTGGICLPDTVTKIGKEAFRHCARLDGELILSSNLESIGMYAFYNCRGLTGDLILPPGLTKVGSYAFSNCSSLGETLVIPYGVTITHSGLGGSGVFAGMESVTTLYLPVDFDSTNSSYKNFYNSPGIQDIYYGGTESDWQARNDKSCVYKTPTIHYDSYPAKSLNLYGGGHLSYRVGQTVTLEASYAADEIAEDLSFSWSSSHPDVVKLVDSAVEIRGKGYAAKLTATFEILKESSSQITVTGPFSLKDDCVVSGADSKELTFIPQNDQSAVEPNVMQPGDTMEILFSYRSYSPVAEDLDEFTWKTLVDGVEQSGIVGVSNVQVSADGEFAATLTATVTALDYGGPVEVQVSGPGDCKASCTVSVPKDRLVILQADGTQADNEGVIHLRQKVAEPFTFYVRYETKLTDEAQVAQAIESMVWEASTADFFDYDETEHILGNATVFDPEVTWKKLEDGVYQLQTELTPALEGVTALKVRTAEDENGVFTDDVCLVYATFDVDSYLAELYERDLPEAEQLNRYLYELDAPSQLIVDELERDLGFIGTVAAWEAMEVVFNTVDNPAAAVMNYSVRESDIYYAMLLELLRGSVEEYVDLAAMQATEYGGIIAGHIPDAALMISSLDITESNAFSKWLLDDNGALCRNTFQQKMEVPGLINDFMSAANVFVGTVNDYGQAMANAAILEQTTDSMERVLEAMLAECPATAEAFHEALERCLEQVRKTGDELRQDAELGLIFSAGKRGYQAVFDKVWDGLMDDVKWADPEVAVIYATYQLFSTLSKEIANTDESVEVYYKMLVLEDIREVAVKAAETLQWVWHEDPGSGTAAEYMCALDMLYRVQKVDLQTAQAFAQALIDAPEYNLSGDPAQMEAALESFKEYGTSLDNTYRVFRDMWMTYFREDYPKALLDVQYEDLFAKATGMRPTRVVIVACPVGVQVLDRYGREVAYVGPDRIGSSTDEISVALIGDEKHIYIYGSGYTLRYEGYDEGTMDVTDRTYNPDGTVKQELQYRDLPVKAGETYKAGQTGNLRNPGGSYVAPHVDIGDYAWTLTVENGAAEINGLPAVTGQVHEGVQVPVTARAEMDGKPFLGWTSTVGESIFADPTSPVTTVVMPGRDVVITAVYGQPKPEIAGELELTDGSGEALDAIPAGAFTAKVPLPEEAVRGLLAAYDAGGKLVWIGEGAVAEGICTFTADNAKGDMAELRFFALTAQDAPAQKTVVFPKK